MVVTGIVAGSLVGDGGVPVVDKVNGGNGGVGVAVVGACVVTAISFVAVVGASVDTWGQGVVVAVVVAGLQGVAVVAALLFGICMTMFPGVKTGLI